MDIDTVSILIALTSLLAATVNGALGYGYSSITVPISLLLVSSRVLNPALVVVEVVVNVYALILGRRSIRRVWPQVAPIAIGVLPGVVIGSLVLAAISVEWAKLVTYGALLPLILIQATGVRLPIRRTRAVGVPFGTGVGVLYALTTISGPPLAVYFKNQGLSKDDLKVALAIARVIESGTTLISYAALGMITTDSMALVPSLAPGVLIGLPIGFALIRRVDADVFRRMCSSFDAWLVGFGLSRVVVELGLLPSAPAYGVFVLVMVVDGALWRGFFADRRLQHRQQHGDQPEHEHREVEPLVVAPAALPAGE